MNAFLFWAPGADPWLPNLALWAWDEWPPCPMVSGPAPCDEDHEFLLPETQTAKCFETKALPLSHSLTESLILKRLGDVCFGPLLLPRRSAQTFIIPIDKLKQGFQTRQACLKLVWAILDVEHCVVTLFAAAPECVWKSELPVSHTVLQCSGHHCEAAWKDPHSSLLKFPGHERLALEILFCESGHFSSSSLGQ